MSYYDEIPEPKIVTDWDNLNLDHILCIYLGMDNNIYKINNPNPVKLWRIQEYIGGFDNGIYNLDSLYEKLKSTPNIRNAKIIDIPYYNQDEGRTSAIEFEYFGDRFGFGSIDSGFEEQFFSLINFKKDNGNGIA